MQRIGPFRQACSRQRMPTRQAGGQHMSLVGSSLQLVFRDFASLRRSRPVAGLRYGTDVFAM
jgi:hypothetical protein